MHRFEIRRVALGWIITSTDVRDQTVFVFTDKDEMLAQVKVWVESYLDDLKDAGIMT